MPKKYYVFTNVYTPGCTCKGNLHLILVTYVLMIKIKTKNQASGNFQQNNNGIIQKKKDIDMKTTTSTTKLNHQQKQLQQQNNCNNTKKKL